MRTVTNFNFKWAFTKQASAPPAEMPQDWYWVNLPHTWNAIDGQDGNADFYRGTCWYAKELNKSDLPEGARHYLELQGAAYTAEVFFNGEKLARHEGGFSTWRVDLTDHLKDTNLLAISVDNSVNQVVYPQVADFTFYGGLYRDVNIISVPESHFDLDYCGSPAIKVTPIVEGSSAKVTVETFLTNTKPGQKVKITLKKACGCVAAEAECDGKAEFTLENVHLWNGRKDPYLYTAVAELVEGDQVLDTVSARFGCRSYRVDPDKGFILNGEAYPLRGVSRHQDRWGIGNALKPEHHKEDIDLILEVGATTIRLAHYQHNQVFYDICDEVGLILWAEIPYITTHMDTGRDNTISQMTELIVQNYNHPSIVVWGLSNEIDAADPAKTDAIVENHNALKALIGKLDPTRLTTMAVVSGCPMDNPYVRIPDTVSYNHYFGWYGGELDEYGPWFDKFHEKYPDQPVGISEYGCEALNWHTSDPQPGDYTEEYQALYHEETIKQIMARPYLWATHVWNMFDFGCDGRNEGGEPGQNHKGLVTFDRKYKKDAFYAYKAWLSDEPFVHIAGKRYVDRVEETAKITVYSNQPEVELFANGVSLGKKTAEDHFFKFDVPNSGETKLEAVAGDCRDESLLRKVDTFNEDYRMKEKGVVLNWWDITSVEGCFDLNDKIRAIGKNPEAAAMLHEFVLNATDGKMGGDVLIQGMDAFTAIRGISMLVGVLGGHLDKESLLEFNAKLNKIAK